MFQAGENGQIQFMGSDGTNMVVGEPGLKVSPNHVTWKLWY